MRLIRYVLMSFLFLSGHSAAEITSIEHAINTASHQSMLTQQMLKDYMLIGLSVRGRKAEQELAESIDDYEETQKLILDYAKTDAEKQALKRAVDQWEVVKPLYLAKPTREKATEVRQATELLLQQWSAVTMEIVENNDSRFGKVISTAGFVRMLAQRVTSHYALRAWGFQDEYSEAFISSLQLFEQNRSELEGDPLNNDQIKAELSKIQRDFKRFKGLSDSASDKGRLALVVRSAEKITTSMDKVTAMYVYQGLSF
ncbi:hypothetical protein [Neptuniibacter sp. QD37_11]|uniref:hypothetical protein n=1 Tax=Neptuniibacter sp. QD37_11 TaxID=3398209 RepID=UPI0039F5F3FD